MMWRVVFEDGLEATVKASDLFLAAYIAQRMYGSPIVKVCVHYTPEQAERDREFCAKTAKALG